MNLFIINAIVSFFAALVLHELGHYFAARMCAVPSSKQGLVGDRKFLVFV